MRGCGLEAAGLPRSLRKELDIKSRDRQRKKKTARDRWKDLGSKLRLNWTSVSRKVDRSAVAGIVKGTYI